MKNQLENLNKEIALFIESLNNEFNINIHSSLTPYIGDNGYGIYGTLTVGRLGFTLNGTFYPHEGTDQQYKIDEYGRVFYYRTREVETGKPWRVTREYQGHYKVKILKDLSQMINTYIGWAKIEKPTTVDNYIKALKTINERISTTK